MVRIIHNLEAQAGESSEEPPADNGALPGEQNRPKPDQRPGKHVTANPGAMITVTPIVGISAVSLEQAVKWAKRNNAYQRFVGVADYYWYFVAQSGIRPEVLFAQAALETGFGRFSGQVTPEQNNWAGIKTAFTKGDAPEDHESFASPQDRVRAHFNHMAAYVGLSPLGEPHCRYHVVIRTPWAGTIKTVEELSGRWAASATYHVRIVKMIEEMSVE